MIFNSILDILFVMILCILFKSSILGGLLWHQASGSAIVLLPGGGEGPWFWLSVCWNPPGGSSPSLRLGRWMFRSPIRVHWHHPGVRCYSSSHGLHWLCRGRNQYHRAGMKVLASLPPPQRWCGCLSIARWSTSPGTASPVTLWGWLHLMAVGQSEI